MAVDVGYLPALVISCLALAVFVMVATTGNERLIRQYHLVEVPPPCRKAFVMWVGRCCSLMCTGVVICTVAHVFPAVCVVEVPGMVATVLGAVLLVCVIAGVGRSSLW